MKFMDALSVSLANVIEIEDLKNYAPEELWVINPIAAAEIALSSCGKFNLNDYLQRYPDILRAGVDPIWHFVNYGIYEDRIATKSMLLNSFDVNINKNNLQYLSDETNDICSVIVTLWKRKNYISEQYNAVIEQSIKPCEIIYIINEKFIDPKYIIKKCGENVRIIQSDINSLYTRFAIAYIASGKYVAILDDDVIPGKLWLSNAKRVCESRNALVTGTGRIWDENGKFGFFRMISSSKRNNNEHQSCSENDILCDWGCNSYFFKREWVGLILSSPRYNNSFKTYDDIQLATSLYANAGIPCFVPCQPEDEPDCHANFKELYGDDEFAIWKTNSDIHFKSRKSYLMELFSKGYIPVKDR